MFSGQQEDAQGQDVVDTVDKLRAKVRSAMEEATRDTINSEVENKILHQVVAGSEVCFPQALVNAEIGKDIDELLENLKKRKLTMEDYLKYRDITAEQLQDEFEERARRELKTRLVLRRIVDDEGLKVDQEDIEAELKSMAVASKVPVETVRAYVEKTDGMSSIKNRILTEKVMDFLVESTNIKDVG
jgi:trigger factor